MVAIPNSEGNEPERTYAIRIVTVPLGGDNVLLYGEAVDLALGEPIPTGTDRRSVPPTSTVIEVSLAMGTLSRRELDGLLRDLETGNAQWDGRPFKTGRLVRREKTIVPVLYGLGPDDGATLHPDGRYTYVLEEWWDADEQTLQRLWDTRYFSEVGTAVSELIGVELHQVSDRVGNFLVFDRLSPWRIDSQSDVRAPVRWVRALSDEPPTSTPLRLHVRVLDGHETVSEQVLDLSPHGIPISGTDYTHVSYSLFDGVGRLLARSAGTVFPEPTISSGTSNTGNVVDSSGTSFSVEWPPWPGGTPEREIRADKPWVSRAGRRSLRNLKQRERATTFTYGHHSTASVLDRLREILREQTIGFVYVWDPYVNAAVVLDLLQWIHPQVPSKILCGESSSATKIAALQRALVTLRVTPSTRSVECKHRVELRGGQYRAHYHDRFVITKTGAWILGSSLNSIGRAPGSIIRLFDPDPLRWMFEDEWLVTVPANVTETVL